MVQVGLRELKNRLSEYVRLVRQGEPVEVTDRGVVVAQLIAPPARTGRGLQDTLADLERRGILRSPTAPGRGRYPRRRRIAPRASAQRLLDEERGER